MSDNHRHTYRALVAALRAEFSPIQIESLNIQLDQKLYEIGAVGVLRQALSDAWDVAYDATVASTEYAWWCGIADCQVGTHSPVEGADQERWARARAVKAGAVYVREVTDWRAES